jgi:hypothetical protein
MAERLATIVEYGGGGTKGEEGEGSLFSRRKGRGASGDAAYLAGGLGSIPGQTDRAGPSISVEKVKNNFLTLIYFLVNQRDVSSLVHLTPSTHGALVMIHLYDPLGK